MSEKQKKSDLGRKVAEEGKKYVKFKEEPGTKIPIKEISEEEMKGILAKKFYKGKNNWPLYDLRRAPGEIGVIYSPTRCINYIKKGTNEIEFSPGPRAIAEDICGITVIGSGTKRVEISEIKDPVIRDIFSGQSVEEVIKKHYLTKASGVRVEYNNLLDSLGVVKNK